MSRIVVVGGVARGMSAPGQATRPQPEAEGFLERGPCVSPAACGMPCSTEDPCHARKRLHPMHRKGAAAVGRDAR